jgi:carbamoyl-phosphate synthase large subunit
MVSDKEATSRCLDKLEFSKYCLSADIPAIPSYENIDACRSDWYVVKERRGAGSLSIGIKLDYIEAKKHALTLSEPIFQPFVEGVEISVDAYIDKNNLVHGVVLRRRDQVVDGESRITTTINNEKIEKMFLLIIKKLGLFGHVILQALVDKNNDVHVIECNCRFGGASTLSVKAGLYSFYWFLIESIGQDLKSYPFIKSKKQIKQVRIPKDVYIYGPDF